MRHYGVVNPSHSPELFEKAQKSGKKIKMHETGIMYRGTYEQNFLDFCLSNNINVLKGNSVKYKFEGKNRIYHSDFLIKEYNLICEIKSKYYYDKYYDKNIAKEKASISEGYDFIFIIDKNYQKFIEKFI